MLGFDLEAWNTIKVVCIGVTAFAGCVTLMATMAAAKLQKEAEETAKRDLELYKLESGASIARAHEETAKANAAAQEAKLELAKFREPRHLTAETKKVIIDRVKGLPAPFALISSNGAEPLDYALDIGRVLSEAGWSWRDFPGGIQTVAVKQLIGLSILDHVEVQTTASHEASALALLEAFKTIGAPDVRRGPNAKDRDGVDGPFVFIFVGGKR